METGRSTNHSPELMGLLQKLIIPEFPYGSGGFRDRLQELKEHYKQLVQKSTS
jgi:hypothetical protein